MSEHATSPTAFSALFENKQKPVDGQRTWVGLTDEEIIIMSCYDLERAALIGEVQRKLKEKNT